MRVPLSWLREYCATDLSAEGLAEALTAQGVEVDRVLRPWQRLAGVRVARVLGVRDHPNADRLCVATIDDASGEREVVVGVRNMAEGDAVPYAPPGASLPGLDEPLERRAIRGVTSEGMLCSPKELEISGDHSAILILPSDAEPGTDLAAYLGLDDAVLDIEVFPNRPDLLSIVGVAREVAAATGEELVAPDPTVGEGVDKAGDAATVEIRDRQKCPRYLARVIRGVRVGPSPLSVQVRLAAAGMRPLGNVVDATNYVLLEMGHPLHPFDLHRLAGPGIVVRRADDGERLVTLDGAERMLTGDDLLIADTERAVAVAGVIGGGDSEVSDRTTDVLLESAYFDPLGIARTARRLGLRTEASVRFERGADPSAVDPAASRAAALIAAWSGGTVLAGAIDVGDPPQPRRVSVRPARARALLGVEVSASDIRAALGRLRLPASEEGDAVVVEVPTYRVDLEREVDLVEEVGRISGYDRIPSSLPGVRQAGGLTLEQRARRRIRDILAGAGLWEAHSFSFASASDLELFDDARRSAVRIANPVSEGDAFLRTSLVPGLLRAARRNVAHRRTSVRLFEVGAAFAGADGAPVEDERLAVLVTGPAAEEWPLERRPQDFLDAKGLLEHLLRSLGIDGWSLEEMTRAPYHPGRSAAVLLDGEPIGDLGEIHPKVAEDFDLPGRVAAFELLVAPLATASVAAEVEYRDVSRFPPVHRDLAFLLDREVRAGEVRDALARAAGPLLDRLLLFDVFEGSPLPEGKKSLAFSLDLRAADRTLTDEEADAVVREVAERLASELGAELRSA